MFFYFLHSYIVPVLFLSVALNIPKFFEAKLIWQPVDGGSSSSNATAASCDEVACEVDFDVTDLRNDQNYIRFYINWTALFTTGLIPMAALIYFNFSIFRGRIFSHCYCKQVCSWVQIAPKPKSFFSF